MEQQSRQPSAQGGRIEVLPRAIAAVAARAAAAAPGVASLAETRGAPGGRSGVTVEIRGGELAVELDLELVYGAPIEQVAQDVRERVRAALAQALGGADTQVVVRVAGLRGAA
jgi:uncharacterized alkaline shock family protein YloU